MRMKTVYACLMILFFTTLPVFAQDQQSGDGRQPPSTADIVEMMQTKLNLTPDQVTAITPILEKYAAKREELRQSMEDGTADKDTLRGQMKQLKTDQSQELGQVLSADQLTQWEQMQSQHHHKHNSDGEGGGSGNDGNGDGGAGNGGGNGGGE